MPVLPPPPKHLAGSHGSQSSSPSHPPLNKASAALSFLDDELLSLGRRAQHSQALSTWTLVLYDIERSVFWWGRVLTTAFRTERPSWDPEQPTKAHAKRVVQSVDLPAGTPHLICEQNANCVHEYITEGSYFLVCVYRGRLQLQVRISLAVQLVQGPQLTHPPLLLLHRICRIWWAFQITAGTLTSAGNLHLHLLNDSVAIGDPSCEMFPVCPVRWQLEGAALGFLQQCLLLCPGKAVPPHPLSSSIQCPALLRCPTPRPGILAQPLAVHCFTFSPPVILRFTAAQDELQTSHWAMCTSLWKPSDPVRTENVLGLFPK